MIVDLQAATRQTTAYESHPFRRDQKQGEMIREEPKMEDEIKEKIEKLGENLGPKPSGD